MGGALVTQFMEKSALSGRVAGLVLDAPVLDWRKTIEFNATQMNLPGFLARPVESAVDVRIDPDWGDADALRHTDDLHLPILLFHGEDDDVVPIEHQRRPGRRAAPLGHLPPGARKPRTPRAGTSTRGATNGASRGSSTP